MTTAAVAEEETRMPAIAEEKTKSCTFGRRTKLTSRQIS